MMMMMMILYFTNPVSEFSFLPAPHIGAKPGGGRKESPR